MRVKRRLRQAPLHTMKLAFAGQQPIAQHRLGQIQPRMLVEFVLLRDENRSDQIRMAQDVEMGASNAKMSDRPVTTELFQKYQGISAQLQKGEKGRPAFGARRAY